MTVSQAYHQTGHAALCSHCRTCSLQSTACTVCLVSPCSILLPLIPSCMSVAEVNTSCVLGGAQSCLACSGRKLGYRGMYRPLGHVHVTIPCAHYNPRVRAARVTECVHLGCTRKRNESKKDMNDPPPPPYRALQFLRCGDKQAASAGRGHTPI